MSSQVYLFYLMATLHWMQEIPERMKASYDIMFSHCQQTMPLSFILLNNFVGFGGCGVVRYCLYLVLSTYLLTFFVLQHLWSVAVQMHLFVMFGVLVKLLAPRCVCTWTAFVPQALLIIMF